MTGRKILLAHPVPGLYGADRMMLAAMQVLAARGDDITVVVPETGPLLPLLERAGINTRLVHFPVLRKALLRPLPLLRLALVSPWHVLRLWRLIRTVRPDLVYANTLTLAHWMFAARLARVPVLCHVREAEQGMGRTRARLLLAPVRLSAVVVANSTATARWITDSQPALADRIRVVYNGFDFPAETERAPRSGPTRLLVVGRLSPRKGQDLAVQAVGVLAAAGHDVHLHLVGDVFRGYEWYEAQLGADIRRLGLAGRVFLDGFQADPAQAYSDADIVLVPSRLEPFGNVAVEAMAAGRPVVAARIGGLPEIVDHDRTGLLCRPDDVDDLVLALTRLLDEPALAQRLAAAAAVSARQRFGMPRFAEELEAAVRSATGREEVVAPGRE